MMNRRQTLQVMAGIAVATAGSGVTWNDKEESTSSTRGDAYEPWRTWPHGSGLMLAASAAVLAASPHNTQPWQFHIAANRVELFADPKRRLGTIDPLLREQQIGTGCALENLLVAAEATGLGAQEIALDPDPVSNQIALVRFGVRAPRESALYRAVSHRHTNRGPYLGDRAISGALLNEMDSLSTDRDSVQLILWTGRTARSDSRTDHRGNGGDRCGPAAESRQFAMVPRHTRRDSTLPGWGNSRSSGAVSGDDRDLEAAAGALAASCG